MMTMVQFDPFAVQELQVGFVLPAPLVAHATRTTLLGLDLAVRRMPPELPFCRGDDGTRTHDPLCAVL